MLTVVTVSERSSGSEQLKPIRLVTTTMTDLVAARDKRQQRGLWAQPGMAAAAVALAFGLLAFVLYRVGIFDPAVMKLAAR